MRFVLLEHDLRAAAAGTPGGQIHWDLMIETAADEKLTTWRLLADPLRTSGEIVAEPIGVHRREYLEFEGELSGGRGQVRRIDRGEIEILERGDGWLFRLWGDALQGTFEIVLSRNTTVFRACGMRRTT